MTLGRDVGLGFLAAAALAMASIGLSACGARKEPAAATAMAAELAPELNAWIAVPSEPKFRYRALDVERAGKGQVRIVVERDASGVKHYDERLINCDRQTFSLERQADSQADLTASGRATRDMIPWVAGTPDDKIARYACAVAPV